MPNKHYSSKSITSKSITDLSSHNIYIANNKLRQQCSSKSFTHQSSNNDSDIIITTDDNNILTNVVSMKDTTSLESTSKSLNHRNQNNDPNIISNKNNDITTDVSSRSVSKLPKVSCKIRPTTINLPHPTNETNDPNIIINNDDDIVIPNITPLLEYDSNKITRPSLTIDDQSSTHQSDSLSIDELQL